MTPTFGRLVTAMVTQMHADGIVVNGTTGESPTLDDAESLDVLRAVRDEVGDAAVLTFGCGSNDTRHSVRFAQQAADAGADALLVVTPYYNLPTQDGIVEHTTRVADSTDLPVLLYDIPHRTGRAFAFESLVELATLDNVRGVKDAKGDLWFATKVMAETGLQWYSGGDELNLAHLTNGAVGIVSVVGHVAGARYAAMMDAIDAGDLDVARVIHRDLVPLVDALMSQSQGAIMTKAALAELGVIESAAVRLPYVTSPEEHLDVLRVALRATHIS